MSDYAFTGTERAARQHHKLLADLDDPMTLGRIQARFQAGMKGMRVWEVACGDGNVARTLADYVEPNGSVLATDIDISRFGPHDAVEVMVHDLVNDPPPRGVFDFVHARRILSHLEDREAILVMLLDCLAPGGTVLLEDWVHPQNPLDMLTGVVPDPRTNNRDDYCMFQYAVWRVLGEQGHDRRFGMNAYGSLDDYGLVELDAGATSTMWRGGGPACRLQDAALQKLDKQLGLPVGVKENIHKLLNDTTFVLRGYPMHYTWGRKPGRSKAS
jgi:SAM-dependent methyltransferase